MTETQSVEVPRFNAILAIFIFSLSAGTASAFTVTETGKHSTAGYAYDVTSSMDYLYIADTTGLQIHNTTDEHLAASFSELRRLTSVAVCEDKAYVV